MTFSEKLTGLRRKSGMSQEQLADRLGVTRQSVSKWEGGTAMPELVKLISLSELFGVSVDYLVKDWMEEPDNPCGGSGEISSKQADRLEKKVDELTNYVKGRVYRYDSKTRIFGLPLWPGLEAGTIASRPGPLMARSNEVTVTVEGRSVHMSRADEGLDALTAGISYLQRAYDMMEQLPPDQPRVLRFGKMVSGTVRNAISGRTVLEGSLRTYREDTFRFCRQQLKDIGRSVAAETGCSLDVHRS